MASREHQDPYAVLGVSRKASAAEIARAYRRAARATHPDAGGSGGDGFREVRDAYELLRDPGRRADYDRLRPRRAPRVAGGSVRYAEPGSQHVVLGGRAPSAPEAEAEALHVVLRRLP